MAEIEPRLRAVLLAGAAQLLLLDRVPDHAAIHESVEWAKREIRPGAGGVVNAVLRRLSRLRAGAPDAREHRPTWSARRDEIPLADGRGLALADDALPESPIERIAIATSHPVSLLQSWAARWPRDVVQRLAWHSLAHAPTILNTAHAQADRGPPTLPPHDLPGHHVFDGDRAALLALLHDRPDVWVQDPASSGVVAACADRAPSLIVDVCAGTGTKTRQLAATFPHAQILATDIDPGRLASLSAMFKGHPRVRIAPRNRMQSIVAGKADLVLLDVPCSNTGVLARRIEAKYRAAPEQIQRLAGIQRQIFADALLLRAPGGAFAYATCSIEPEENQAHARWAAAWHSLRLVDSRQILPQGDPGGPARAYHDGSAWMILE